MNFGRCRCIFNSVRTHFGLNNEMGVVSSSYSTLPTARKWATMEAPQKELFLRISPLGNRSISLIPILDEWVAEGNPVEKPHLQFCIKELRHRKRYSQALEMSLWMTDKRFFPMTVSDCAIRLDLIGSVHGIKAVENYFDNIPKRLEGLEVYSALLNCYVRCKSVEKAEAVMERMRNLGLDRSHGIRLPFNCLLTLYYKTGNYKKMDTLMHEMEEKGIACDVFTYCIYLSAYATQCDVDAIDNILQKAESGCSLTWNFYVVAGDAYIKVGHTEKALAMLKKSEELSKKSSKAYDHLLTLYATLGKKEEVLRLWELYKWYRKVYNKGYLSMISSLLKLDDVEGAEKIFDEWESQTPLTLCYDLRIPNFLLGAYARKGLLEKFESVVNRIRLKGGKPDVKTWYCYATVLLLHNEMEKAVNAMEEAILISQPWWKPSEESLAACLKYLKGEGDIDEAEKLVNLLGDRNIISSEVQVKLLSYVKDGNVNSTMDRLLMHDGGALHGSEEIHQFSEGNEDSIDHCK